MKNRFKRTILTNIFSVIFLHFYTKRIAKKNIMPFADRYKFASKYINKYHKSMNLDIMTYGMQNIDPNIKGCLIIGNHQGRTDCISVMHVLKDFPTSFVVADNKSHRFLFSNVCDMLQAKRIKFDDLRSQARVYSEMKNDILKGQRFIIFPEAGYKDNKNTLQDFHTPAFSLAIKTKCPIIPFCLYDSWKAYNKDYAGYYKLQFQCHILPPIYYDEYKDLNKRELAALVKSRIQNKLDEIKNNSLSQ